MNKNILFCMHLYGWWVHNLKIYIKGTSTPLNRLLTWTITNMVSKDKYLWNASIKLITSEHRTFNTTLGKWVGNSHIEYEILEAILDPPTGILYVKEGDKQENTLSQNNPMKKTGHNLLQERNNYEYIPVDNNINVLKYDSCKSQILRNRNSHDKIREEICITKINI